jgi:hypothetical protein
MTLLCGNCANDCYGDYFMLFLLEQEGGKLAYIDEFERHVSPNSALCSECVGSAHQAGAHEVSSLKSGYALVTASSGGGRAQWSCVVTDATTAVYFDEESAKIMWPRALDIIAHLPRLSPLPDNRAFVDRLFAHLRSGDVRFHAMAELAPGMIVVQDDYREGELDVFFDLELWGPKNPQLWGDSLTPAGLMELGMGVLSCTSFGNRPRNFTQFLPLAQYTLMPRQDASWHPIPRAFKVPKDLQA